LPKIFLFYVIREYNTSRVVGAGGHDSSSVEFLLRVCSLLKTRYKALDVVETMVQQQLQQRGNTVRYDKNLRLKPTNKLSV